MESKKELLVNEFHYDAKIQEYSEAGDQTQLEDYLYRMFVNRCQLYGWRATYLEYLIDGEVKSTYNGVHVSPAAELDFRATELATKQGLEYSEAIARILQDDPLLESLYSSYSPQKFYEAWRDHQPIMRTAGN
jgi:hypothetical protein